MIHLDTEHHLFPWLHQVMFSVVLYIQGAFEKLVNESRLPHTKWDCWMCVVVGILFCSFSTQITPDGRRGPRGVGIQEGSCPIFSPAGSILDGHQGKADCSRSNLAFIES